MRDEKHRLMSWKENILEAAKHIYEGDHIHASFKLGFTLQGIMIAIAEMEKEMGED